MFLGNTAGRAVFRCQSSGYFGERNLCEENAVVRRQINDLANPIAPWFIGVALDERTGIEVIDVIRNKVFDSSP